ncbi:MAG: YdcF family protein [Gemmatimonadaceae bacterium]
MPPRVPWSLRRRLAFGFGAALTAGWLLSALSVYCAASHDAAVPADAIVVLGAAQYRGRPSPVLRARLDHGIALYARGLAPRLVLTGGIAEGDTASEAAVGRAYVLEAGVPDSAILLENDGRTTSQSLAAVARLLRSRQMDRVVLVSDPFHVLRASRLASREGLTVHTSPTRTDSTWRRVVRQPTYFLSETVKAPLALIVGW